MPFIHTAVLSPMCIRFIPVLILHAAVASCLLLTSSAASGAAVKTATVLLCTALTAAHLYMSERARRRRVLDAWRLERATAACLEVQGRAAAAELALVVQGSALRRAAAEGQAATRVRLLKWVCHEIRNPITGVIGSLEMLVLRASARDAQCALSAPQLELVANARTCADSIKRVSWPRRRAQQK